MTQVRPKVPYPKVQAWFIVAFAASLGGALAIYGWHSRHELQAAIALAVFAGALVGTFLIFALPGSLQLISVGFADGLFTVHRLRRRLAAGVIATAFWSTAASAPPESWLAGVDDRPPTRRPHPDAGR